MRYMSDNLLFIPASHERSRFLPRISFAFPPIRDGTRLFPSRGRRIYICRPRAARDPSIKDSGATKIPLRSIRPTRRCRCHASLLDRRDLAHRIPPAVTPMSCCTCVKFLNAEKLSKGQSEGKRAADREMRASFSLRPF